METATDPRRIHVRTLTGPDLRKARGLLTLSQTEIAGALGVAQNSWGRWERQDVEAPPWLGWAILGLLAEANPGDYGTVANLLNLTYEADHAASETPAGA